MQDYEKLGLFYLGREYDVATKTRQEGLVLYDSRDLVTHAVCVGMTGSGKTGLCLTLLEEAALDGIPVIAIDPKGDLGNLLLTFPQMRPEDLRPWVNPEDAARRGMSVDDHAREQAEKWRKGLADWDQDLDRIGRLRAAAEFSIYTPGSNAGLPVSILESFAAPPPATRDDSELFAERVDNTATSLLTLVGGDADAVRSREHVLLATILSTAWKAGADVDLATLIQQIQKPPVTRVGVLDLESFYPAAERFQLAMRLNQLLAAPGFDAWRQGDPLDVDRLLYTAQGKPRVSIFSIAHLDDVERMFFVSLLLNQVRGWMRTQSGTTSLRAILYMDEIVGFFPPVANPPSKQPLLTLLKQGRAFGLGVVLATQNPVDLDYKGLSNAGTWLLGRLQTERDKARVLDGLEGSAAASGGFDRREIEQTLAALDSRVFLMHNVHQGAPRVLQSRWAMSYLRGPMTREEIKTLMADQKAARNASPAAATTQAAPPANAPSTAVPAQPPPGSQTSPASGTVQRTAARPVLPSDVPAYFLSARSAAPPDAQLLYEPALFGAARLHFVDPKLALDFSREASFVASFSDGPVPLNWDSATELGVPASDLSSEPEGSAYYAEPPAAASRAKSYDKWTKEFGAWLYRTQRLPLLRSGSAGVASAPEESERAFRIRLQSVARDSRSAQIDRIQTKYAARRAALVEAIRRAELAVSRESEQAQQQKIQTGVSFVATALSAFFGRKAVSVGTLGRATTTARGMGRVSKESQDVERVKKTEETKRDQLADLDAEIKAEADAIGAATDPVSETLETLSIAPKKTDIGVQLVALVWLPFWKLPDGRRVNAWSSS